MSDHRLHRIHYEREARRAEGFDSCSLRTKAWAFAYLTVVSWLILAAIGFAIWSFMK